MVDLWSSWACVRICTCTCSLPPAAQWAWSLLSTVSGEEAYVLMRACCLQLSSPLPVLAGSYTLGSSVSRLLCTPQNACIFSVRNGLSGTKLSNKGSPPSNIETQSSVRTTGYTTDNFLYVLCYRDLNSVHWNLHNQCFKIAQIPAGGRYEVRTPRGGVLFPRT